MTTIGVSEARAALPELLDRVIAGEEITITRHGQPVAVLLRPDSLRSRRADEALATGERIGRLLDDGRRARLPAGGLTEARAEELVAEVRAGRRRR